MADRIRMRARVTRALHYLDTAGASWVHLQMAQTPQQHHGHRALLGLVARRPLGTGPAAQMAAASLAHHLRPGDDVLVWADAVALCPHTGHILLQGCTQIERLDRPAPDPQPTAALAAMEHAA